jgi:hypothetical protein
MIRLFHPCMFNFADEDIRIVGSTISGGTSLSGYEDSTETSGGGFWRADFLNADFGGPEEDDRAVTLAWRAVNGGMNGGSVPVDVMFCDALHQPITGPAGVPYSDGTPLTAEALEAGSGARGAVMAVVNGQVGGLRATVIDVAIASERPLLGGERFTLVHPTWGPRAYQTSLVEDVPGGKRLTFSPPIRGGVAVADYVDFTNIRCRMRRVSEPSNALSMGAFGSGSISFQEDMRRPA